ncbi:MAG: transport-associated protein [Desulfovibrio sp.]
MRVTKIILVAMMICTLFLSVVGCSEEGPAEKAGKQIDNAVKDAKDGVKKFLD